MAPNAWKHVPVNPKDSSRLRKGRNVWRGRGEWGGTATSQEMLGCQQTTRCWTDPEISTLRRQCGHGVFPYIQTSLREMSTSHPEKPKELQPLKRKDIAGSFKPMLGSHNLRRPHYKTTKTSVKPESHQPSPPSNIYFPLTL